MSLWIEFCGITSVSGVVMSHCNDPVVSTHVRIRVSAQAALSCHGPMLSSPLLLLQWGKSEPRRVLVCRYELIAIPPKGDKGSAWGVTSIHHNTLDVKFDPVPKMNQTTFSPFKGVVIEFYSHSFLMIFRVFHSKGGRRWWIMWQHTRTYTI